MITETKMDFVDAVDRVSVLQTYLEILKQIILFANFLSKIAIFKISNFQNNLNTKGIKTWIANLGRLILLSSSARLAKPIANSADS